MIKNGDYNRVIFSFSVHDGTTDDRHWIDASFEPIEATSEPYEIYFYDIEMGASAITAAAASIAVMLSFVF